MNGGILDGVTRQGKKIELVGVQLDLTKAFDTVSHDAIMVILNNYGVSEVPRSAIQRIYPDTTTLLGNMDLTIPIQRGVKQRDPLSPLLFNIMMDPLLQEIQALGGGFRIVT